MPPPQHSWRDGLPSVLCTSSFCSEISDDDASDVSVDMESASSIKEEETKPQPKARGRVAAIKAEPIKAEAEPESDNADAEEEEEEGEDDDDDVGEDEYVVEKITNHLVDEASNELRFEVKWEGYEKKSDRTWEPEENLLETASKILEEYLASVGGKDQIMADFHEKKAGNSGKGKKRSRVSTDAETNGSAKRGRKSKNGVHPESTTPPASAEFKPPTGNWEEQIIAIDACEGGEGSVVVYLTWKGGHKTQHPLSQVYKRCPQRMLKFYESHLVFKKNDEA
ncbi:Chromatin-associated protein swi6 [Lachnellula suecica]|uniref:Chromatin-associated protein swi6 n=1 Tax=Lachnellula suecica TaxID=602035 RepID=A0A8T9BXJ9_9HELO|nr:Chromatin-associated protein swi6 [Lachnellula suecica]